MNALLRPRKTFRGLTVYERLGSVTDRGCLPKYVVARDSDGHHLEDFKRYAQAVRWAKIQPEGQ